MGKKDKTWERLQQCYKESAKSIICRLFGEFERGCRDINDAERTGHQNEDGTPKGRFEQPWGEIAWDYWYHIS